MLRKMSGTMSLLEALDDGIERLLQWGWRHRKALAAGLGLLVAAWAVGGGSEAPPPQDEVQVVASAEDAGPDAGELFDRLWVDHIPKNHKDSFRMYFFLKAHPVGVHLIFHSMTYRTQEFFMHEVKGKEIRFNFPDPGVKPVTKAGFEAVKGDKHFDMKMTLSHDPQAKGVPYSYHRLKKEASRELLAGYGISEAALAAALEAR